MCFCRRRPFVVIHFSLSNCRPKRLCSFSMISNEEGRERPITTITTAATRCSRLIETTVVRRGGGVPDVNEFLCSSHHRQLFCDDVFGLLKEEFFSFK